MNKLKQQRLNEHQTVKQTSQTINMYFILAYSSEFDKVHYPLILNYSEISDANELKRIICSLQKLTDNEGCGQSPEFSYSNSLNKLGAQNDSYQTNNLVNQEQCFLKRFR